MTALQPHSLSKPLVLDREHIQNAKHNRSRNAQHERESPAHENRDLPVIDLAAPSRCRWRNLSTRNTLFALALVLVELLRGLIASALLQLFARLSVDRLADRCARVVWVEYGFGAVLTLDDLDEGGVVVFCPLFDLRGVIYQ